MLTKQDIVELLKKDDRAVARALVVLNERQTADEQASENTKYHNGRGFRPCHARMGTSMAKFFTARGYLTPKQIAYFRKTDRTGKMRIEIYAGQLLEAAEAKAARATPTGQVIAAAKAAAKQISTPKMIPVTANDATSQAGCKGGEEIEREMQRMEAEGDREQTIREEEAKFRAKAAMEGRAMPNEMMRAMMIRAMQNEG